jgi:AcrR family transcriptional regulator
MQRNRLQREQRLIEAVGEIVKKEGFDQLGINKIASTAGVNKMLIYRYFGGLSGLIDAYLRQTTPVVFAPPIDVERLKTASLEEFFQACTEYLITEFRMLRQNVTAQEFLKADLFNVMGSNNPLASAKEAQVREMIDALSTMIGAKHGPGFAALIISGLTQLTFSAQQQKVVFGIDLQTDEGWAEIEATLTNVFRGSYLFTKERLELERASMVIQEQAQGLPYPPHISKCIV